MHRNWLLDPGIDFLNHGSFGACPLPVLRAQQTLRERMEREPVRFFVRDLPGLLDRAREELAGFLGASARDLVFVPNATYAINSVLRSLRFEPGDELLCTDHEYNACRNALGFVAARESARVVVASVPFPLHSPEQVLEALTARITRRTRLVLLDHVSSQTGLILPVERIVAACAERGVDTLVDGAHAPGMVPLRIEELSAAYYAGNCHKWLSAPKGAAFLWMRRDRQSLIRPLAISHGANSPRTDRPRHHLEFDYLGTDDPTAFLCVPEAIRFMGSLLPGGWPDLMEGNHSLALRARALLCSALSIEPPCPDEMIGSIASLPLPDSTSQPPTSPLYADPLQDALLLTHGFEVPVIPWPTHPRRLLRISAQVYNNLGQYQRLAAVLQNVLFGKKLVYPSGA